MAAADVGEQEPEADAPLGNRPELALDGDIEGRSSDSGRRSPGRERC